MSEVASNRAAMPAVAQLVDEIRAQGVSVRVIYAQEGGQERGRKPEDKEVFDIPANYRKPAGGWK